MPDAYEVYEGRFLAVAANTSGAAALTSPLAAVPSGRVYTYLTAYLSTDDAVARNYWFAILRGAYYFPITIPQSFTVAFGVYQDFPMLREGMEIKLFPGEQLVALRSAAGAGTTLSIIARYIDSPLPIYEEYEPQVRRAQLKKRSTGQRSIGGGGGSSGGEGPEAGPPPGGPGESIPGY